jgi:hypothetical protein
LTGLSNHSRQAGFLYAVIAMNDELRTLNFRHNLLRQWRLIGVRILERLRRIGICLLVPRQPALVSNNELTEGERVFIYRIDNQ